MAEKVLDNAPVNGAINMTENVRDAGTGGPADVACDDVLTGVFVEVNGGT